ncbi:hypothetical protein PU629_14090 [Pullulanibacillus sp. KACC 23026]|uniref:hypothetical protein n=1 Tax=Pullulanibacillus sp. KACC 23026 TaxID=3028315 RepID=UPI0023AF7DC4|nr:hypothetical protein [Pullulanibacillus sp. KACC 23026]WEG11291.1 hypothetical protein PU629_14090 [Pullulanibacillus sp. KACC 23026]
MHEETLYKRLFAPFILLVLAYEWIASGIDKLFNHQFPQELNRGLSVSINKLPRSVVANFLNRLTMAHPVLFAVVLEVGELCLGICFFVIAMSLFRNKLTKLIRIIGIWAGIISSIMAINFPFLKGEDLFLDITSNNRGLSMDFLLFLVQIWVAIFFFTLDRKQVSEELYPDEYNQ